MAKNINNQAFIDGQNLYLNTLSNSWHIDLIRFRIYLREKYNVQKAYYFLGAENEENKELYELLQTAGFILCFREHLESMTSLKKGNVDTDIVFTIMYKLLEKEDFDNIVLVSGDGDYFKMVKYLVKIGRFEKLLSPNRKSTSSLYRGIPTELRTYLDAPGTKSKIELKKKRK